MVVGENEKELPHTVDGVKEALLKEFERDAAFQGKSVHHLTVYSPGSEKGVKALGNLDDIALTPRDDEPYHVGHKHLDLGASPKPRTFCRSPHPNVPVGFCGRHFPTIFGP